MAFERRGLFHSDAAMTNDGVTFATTGLAEFIRVRDFAGVPEVSLQEQLPSP
jgi:hypothetical protein